MRYVPGTLEAVTYDASGKMTGKTQLVSASGKAEIRIRSEKEQLSPKETAFAEISIVGENGIVESNADRELSVTVEGGELLGFGSADPRTEDSFVSGRYHTYYGKAMAAVRAGDAEEVKITVTAGSKVYEKKIRIKKGEEHD